MYLKHDNPAASFVLAPSFDEFLRRWEELRYCDQTGLCFFRRRGQLDPSSPAAVQLRDWLPGNEDC